MHIQPRQVPDASDLGITPEELHEIMGMFDTWDSDGSGSISLPELKGCMGSMSLMRLMEFDADGNGELDKVEFVRAMASACYGSTN
jgi:Ca2+-binding EF-hand superfamily protein